jgi:hypothetical protein
MISTLAKHAEIARRYNAGQRDRPFSMTAVRIAELRRVFGDRYGRHGLPDDDAGEDDALIMCHHIARRPVPNHPKLMAAFLSSWAPWMPADRVSAMITTVTANPIRWTADKLGARLRLTEEERERLKITTIGSVDVTKAERARRRQEHKRRREHLRRRRQGAKPRSEYEAQALSRTKPWVALGMSRAGWYRAGKPSRETSPCPA